MDNESAKNEVISRIQSRLRRRQNYLREGNPSLLQQFARVGVLGWLVVTPTLLGIAIGHWLDKKFNTGIFWSAPLLLLGLIIGCCLAWRWVNRS
jgi:ATP synthase protein I